MRPVAAKVECPAWANAEKAAVWKENRKVGVQREQACFRCVNDTISAMWREAEERTLRASGTRELVCAPLQVRSPRGVEFRCASDVCAGLAW